MDNEYIGDLSELEMDERDKANRTDNKECTPGRDEIGESQRAGDKEYIGGIVELKVIMTDGDAPILLKHTFTVDEVVLHLTGDAIKDMRGLLGFIDAREAK